MVTISQSALLPYSAEQMFALVNDIAAYPQFMQGCLNAEVLSVVRAGKKLQLAWIWAKPDCVIH